LNGRTINISTPGSAAQPALDCPSVSNYARYEVTALPPQQRAFSGLRSTSSTAAASTRVTSMLYLDHGLGKDFTGYDDLLRRQYRHDAIAYLMLATSCCTPWRPDATPSPEDVSGMVAFAVRAEGRNGCDYRRQWVSGLSWIKRIKELADEEWKLRHLPHAAESSAPRKHIGFAESHDQALVGDQTLAFRLMGRRCILQEPQCASGRIIRHLLYERMESSTSRVAGCPRES